ncbi:MAG TPA: glycoside hydrolase family 38 C-terminal domain-containing protein [Armatimonadota bacterium]|jgi:alpha-mannosidase
MVTVHLIFNAHIDPIWLWPWTSGLDETLATCRSACDLLDDHPDFIFTRGEAWGYREVERADPDLFARIREHIRAGRWEVVGGWWIQPDCNQPSGFGLERQIGLGKQYCLERFGAFPEVAYNVDSFGHAAGLPDLMSAAGQRFYVMMRPQEHEMSLPSRVFRWRGHDGGSEVTTFRIAGGYGAWDPSLNHVRASLRALPEGVEHTMCFLGVGDHGGGATEKQILWCREHADALDDARLVFSSPRRFFKAIEAQIPSLPLVTGELQHHAVGCYSVAHAMKSQLRRAEHLLRQAEVTRSLLPSDRELAASLETAWERACFHQFHDTLGGTSIPSAYRQVSDDLGYAASAAQDLTQHGLRVLAASLPEGTCQRLVLLNASDAPYDGYVEAEPWLEYHSWGADWRLLGPEGDPVPVQRMDAETLTGGASRLLFRASLAPGEVAAFRIDRQGGPTPVPEGVTVGCDEAATPEGVRLCLGAAPSMGFPGVPSLPLPRLHLIPDHTDNWSHSVDRYPQGPADSPQWGAPCLLDQGPLMASFLQTGTLGRSELSAEWRVYAGDPYVELLLRVLWLERLRLLKLVVPLPFEAANRRDGVLGGSLERHLQGKECPVRDWMLLSGGSSAAGLVCPDVYGADATPWQVRLTLLRAPMMTDHDPGPVRKPRVTYADQGEHTFRFRFFAAPSLSPDLLESHALMLHRPLATADLTRGMKRHADW